jgi:hypothetical protein
VNDHSPYVQASSGAEDDPIGVHQKEICAGIVGGAVDCAEDAGRILASYSTENVVNSRVRKKRGRLELCNIPGIDTELCKAVEEIVADWCTFSDAIHVAVWRDNGAEVTWACRLRDGRGSMGLTSNRYVGKPQQEGPDNLDDEREE